MNALGGSASRKSGFPDWKRGDNITAYCGSWSVI